VVCGGAKPPIPSGRDCIIPTINRQQAYSQSCGRERCALPPVHARR